MKSLEDIQNAIKNEDFLCFIFDYEFNISSYVSSLTKVGFNPMYKRALQNFANKEFIQVIILQPKKLAKQILKLKLGAEHLSFCDIEDLNFDEVEINKPQKTTIIYFGEDKNITKQLKAKKAVIVNIGLQKRKSAFQISKRQFDEFLIETNNLYL